MTLRIEQVSDGHVVILRLSGRLQSEHLEELKAHIEGITQKVILDLDQVKLVDREVVCFLVACELDGVQLNQCSPYIRDWINRERTSP
jgi:anti-anti-sigma regulatory factor